MFADGAVSSFTMKTMSHLGDCQTILSQSFAQAIDEARKSGDADLQRRVEFLKEFSSLLDAQYPRRRPKNPSHNVHLAQCREIFDHHFALAVSAAQKLGDAGLQRQVEFLGVYSALLDSTYPRTSQPRVGH